MGRGLKALNHHQPLGRKVFIEHFHIRISGEGKGSGKRRGELRKERVRLVKGTKETLGRRKSIILKRESKQNVSEGEE